MSIYTNFTDRTSYLAARTAWRKAYAEITSQIYQLRIAIRSSAGADMSNEQYRKAMRRSDARKMMETRTEMTEMMRKQVAAERTEQEAV